MVHTCPCFSQACRIPSSQPHTLHVGSPLVSWHTLCFMLEYFPLVIRPSGHRKHTTLAPLLIDAQGDLKHLYSTAIHYLIITVYLFLTAITCFQVLEAIYHPQDAAASEIQVYLDTDNSVGIRVHSYCNSLCLAMCQAHLSYTSALSIVPDIWHTFLLSRSRWKTVDPILMPAIWLSKLRFWISFQWMSPLLGRGELWRWRRPLVQRVPPFPAQGTHNDFQSLNLSL